MNFSKKNHEHKKNSKNVVSKNLKLITTILAIALGTLTLWSCKDNKKSEENQPMEMTNETATITPPVEKISYNVEGSERTSEMVNAYLKIKDALVADDNNSAMEAGKLALKVFKNFDIGGYSAVQQEKLKGFVESAIENIKPISEGSIKDQRANFKKLSINVEDIIAIAGTDLKLYEIYCPMYERGSAWLSTEKNVKNPFYGSKMLTCGVVKKEIN